MKIKYLRSFALFFVFFCHEVTSASDLGAKAVVTDSLASDYASYRQQVIRERMEDPDFMEKLEKSESVEQLRLVLENEIKDDVDNFRQSYGLRTTQARATVGVFLDPWQGIRDILFLSGPDNDLFSNSLSSTSASNIPCNYRVLPQYRDKIVEYKFKNITSWSYIDALGRPAWSAVFFRDQKWPATAPRQDGGNQCQPSVGGWGFGSSLRYDGGHLVPSRLNGYGGRTNLVPQDRTLNRGMCGKTILKRPHFIASMILWGKVEYRTTG